MDRDWDDQRERFTENTNYYRSLNLELTQASDRIEDTFKTLIINGSRVTAKRIKSIFRGEDEDAFHPMLLPFIEQHIQFMQKQPDTYKPGTIIHYVAMHKRMDTYLRKSGDKRMLNKDFKARDIIGFKEYLLTTIHEGIKRPISPVTTAKYLAKLKVIIANAQMKEIITTDPFSSIKLERVQNDAEWLTREELDRLVKVDLSENESRHRLRLMFLYSVYTGLRFTDAFALLKEDITLASENHYRIEVKVQRTSRNFNRRLLPEAVALYLDMLKNYPNIPTVLAKISNQKMNEYLKVIANLAGIKKSITHHTARLRSQRLLCWNLVQILNSSNTCLVIVH